jgi:hypothetical protein
MKEEIVEPENVSNEDLWKKLKYQQRKLEKLEESMLQQQKKLSKMMEEMSPAGGYQPDTKGLNLFNYDEDRMNLTDVGKDIFKHLKKEDHLDRQDLEDILMDHGISRTKTTYLNYLRTIGAEFNEYAEEMDQAFKVNYKSGKQGGVNGGVAAKVVLEYD